MRSSLLIQRRNHSQEQRHKKKQQLTYKTVAGGPTTNNWKIQWKLSQNSKTGGWIVQENRGSDASGKSWHYWEAWRVEAGYQVTIYNAFVSFDDVFGGDNNDKVSAEARFYEGLQLPSSFIPNNPNTFAGLLPSTDVNPNLPTTNATAPVDRTWTCPCPQHLDNGGNMVKNRSTPLYLAIAAASFLFLGPPVQARGSRLLNQQLTNVIAKVRAGETSSLRTAAAEHLAELTRRINPNRVDDVTLTGMISLLNTSEDSVRFWVAASLGNLGLRARAAVPVLLKLLPEVDCLRGNLTSAPAIRAALSRMGETPPPPKCAGSK